MTFESIIDQVESVQCCVYWHLNESMMDQGVSIKCLKYFIT